MWGYFHPAYERRNNVSVPARLRRYIRSQADHHKVTNIKCFQSTMKISRSFIISIIFIILSLIFSCNARVWETNADAEPNTLYWCDVGNWGGRDWRLESARPMGEKKGAVAIGRGGRVGNGVVGGKEGVPFLSVVGVCSNCLIFFPLCTNWHMLDRS